jgi:isopenicillin N synthase-like dioxygenase
MTVVEIPVIDIGPYIDPCSTAAAKQQVIDDVRSACSHYGFMQIRGHGVPLAAQRKMLESCKAVFDLSIAEKEKLTWQNSRAKR